MQALFKESSGSLVWKEAELPGELDDHAAMVRPLAVAACDLDRLIAMGRSPFPGEFMLGHEFTGEVQAVGESVTDLKVGDIVIAAFQPSCGTCGECGYGHSSVCSAVPNGSMYGIGQTGGPWGGAYADAIPIPWADFNLKVIPAELDPVAIASGSDNLADALRGVDGPLGRRPGGSVLITGSGSIPLYAIVCAQFLGAGRVSFASKDAFALEMAERLGAEVLPVEQWPKRFHSHDVTIDGTNEVDGLYAVIKSTASYGECTSSSIFFTGDISVPMFHMNMKGISFHTGRVNSASQLERVLQLLVEGLDPSRIEPLTVSFAEVTEAFASEPLGRKIIATPN